MVTVSSASNQHCTVVKPSTLIRDRESETESLAVFFSGTFLTAWLGFWVILQHSGQLVGLSYSTVDNWLGCLTAQWTTGWVVSQHSGQLVGLSHSTVDNWLGCLTAQWTTGWAVLQHSGQLVGLSSSTVDTLGCLVAQWILCLTLHAMTTGLLTFHPCWSWLTS